MKQINKDLLEKLQIQSRSVTPKTQIATALEAGNLGEDSILDGLSLSGMREVGSASNKMVSTAKASFRTRS